MLIFYPRNKSLLWAVLLALLAFVPAHVYGQDPPQYGTPFAAVPDPRDITMYQVNIRAFSPGSNLAGVTARLDQIKALGINVVYLLPVFPVGTDSRSKIASSTSPYSIKDFTSVGTEYGTLADLRALVDGAHRRGMAVMLDWVANQTSWDHPWISQHPDWYLRDANGVIQPLNPFPDVAALDFNNPAMRTAMINAMRYWVFAANIDGFRCDYANNAPLDFWSQAISNLRGITSHKLLLFAEGDRLTNFQAGFDLNFGDKFYYDALKPIRNGASVAQLQTTTDTEYTHANASQQVVRYTGNHDTSGEGTSLEVFSGAAGVMANFVVSAYMRGVPFLYNGQEVAFPTRIPWPWDGVDIDWTANPTVTEEFTRVIGFRNSSTAIRRGTMANYSDANVCVFSKTAGTEKVVVLSNLRSTSSTYLVPAALAGTYKDAYSGAALTLTAGASLSLNGFQYRVLTTMNVPVFTRISVSPLNTSITVGTTQQLTATVAPASAQNQPVAWRSSNPAVATVSTTGLVTGIAPGSVTITAVTNGNKTATALITVMPPNNFTVHFYRPSHWGGGIRIYWWAATPAGTLPEISWPGVSMTTEGDGWYSYAFTNVNSTNLIFNDGTNQTGNLTRTRTGWYLDDVWYDTKPEIPDGPGTFYYIKNRWQGNTYLYDDQNGLVRYGTSPATASYQWERVDAGGGFFSLKNRATGNLMHVEDQNGSVQCTALNPGWWSAMWSLPAATDGWLYVQNRWKTDQLVNLEGLTGFAQYSGANTGWYSAMWQFVTVVSTTGTMAARSAGGETTVAGWSAPRVELFPNPAKGKVFTISMPGLPANEPAALTIMDTRGRTALKARVRQPARIEHNLEPGLYLIRISAGSINVTKKIIVE